MGPKVSNVLLKFFWLSPFFMNFHHGLLFRIPSQGGVWLERGRESRLLINNVTYDFQGEYECRASNFINGQERSTTSDPISLQVVGAPQVLHSKNSSGFQVSVKRGESASLTLVVCADPRPRHVGMKTDVFTRSPKIV